MAEESIEQRLRYAKKKAKRYYERLGATIIDSDNHIICFIANFTTHENKIRVTVDRIIEEDFSKLKQINVYPHQSRQIFCSLYKERETRIVELLNDLSVKVLYDPVNPSLKNKILSIPKYLDELSRKP